MKQLYVTLITRRKIDVHNLVYLCLQTSKAEATLEAIANAEKNFPSKEGWVTAGAVIAEAVSDNLILAAAADLQKPA